MSFFNIFITLFLIYTDTACAMHKKSNSYDQVMTIINNYLKPLKKEKNIELRGYGLHYAGLDKIYDGKIHEIDLSVSIQKRMKFDEAKKLYYSIVNGLLEALNKNEALQDCFYHYPVTYKDLYFRLNFDYESKGYLGVGDVSMVAILENEIMYFIVEENGGNVGMETREIVPDVYIGTGLSPKVRCITKKLPEEEE